MDQSLVRTLGSFITRSSDYSLARLEFAAKHPGLAAPPVLDRLPDASERTLRERFAGIEEQLEAIVAFIGRIKTAEGPAVSDDATFGWLTRTAKELEQYARALRWVLTVTERDTPAKTEEPE